MLTLFSKGTLLENVFFYLLFNLKWAKASLFSFYFLNFMFSKKVYIYRIGRAVHNFFRKGFIMKAKRFISLLLCLIMVFGTLPMSIMAEDTVTTAETSEEVRFNLMLDFNRMETTTAASADSFTAAAKDETHFSLTHYNGTGGLSYVDKGDGDIALRTTSTHGLMIKDPQTLLAKNSFVLEYDVRFEKVAAGFNTVQFSFKDNAGTQVKTGLVPINANKLTGADGNKYGATYHMTNNQNIGATVRPSGVSQDLIVYPNQWYHYALYVDSVNNKIVAYRDGSRIWSSTLTSFPDDMTDFQIWMHSGASSSVTHYDNIHLQSLNSTDIDVALDFDDVAFAEGSTSVNATKDMLNDMIGGSRLNFPYVHATNALIETDGTNTYLVGSSTGKTLGSGHGRSFFQLGDSQALLSSQSWTMSFDMCIPGITNDNGTAEDKSDDTVYSHSSYEITFLSLVVDGTSNTILTLKTNGQLGRAKAGNYTTQKLAQGSWYRIFVSHDASNQKLAFALLDNSEGYVDLGSYDFKPGQDASETFFRFGYNWTAGQYCKFYFDNIVLTTDNDSVDIDVDFENGTAGEKLIPADIALGGSSACGMMNGGKYSKVGASEKLKYYADETDNVYLGSSYGTASNWFNFCDASLKTLSQKFVISFDFKVNQATTSYTMASWRIGGSTIPLWIISGGQQAQIRTKLVSGASYAYTSQAFEDGKWYNLATVIDPIAKTAEFHIGGLGTDPVYTTVFEHDISTATLSALTIGPGAGQITVDGSKVNDHLGYDNIRIYTIDETIESTDTPDNINTAELPADGVIIETDFEGFDAGTEMTSEVWNTIAPFWVTATDGTIVEANGNKHFQPMGGSGATSFNISSFNATPYTEGVIALETDFTLGDNSANSGNLVIAALKRIGTDGKTVNIPLLTSDSTGKLTVVQHAIDYTLPAETVRIKIQLSYAFHTVNIYINNKAIATGIPFNVNTTLTPSTSYFTDSFGNKHELPFTGYTYDYGFYNNGMQIVDANGNKTMFPHYYENYGFAQTLSYIRDSIDMFGATTDESWSFAVDNLKIYQDTKADIYFNGFDGWTKDLTSSVSAYDSSGLPVENPFDNVNNQFIIDESGNAVASTIGEGSSAGNGSFHLQDKNNFLSGKNFVLEFDIKYNPDYADVDFGDAASTGMSIFTDFTWDHTIRLHEDGSYGIKSDTLKHGRFKSNDWSRVQALCLSDASSSDHTVYLYIDGALMSTKSAFSIAKILRIGCEKNTYDAQWDNIRIYISDKPDAYDNVSDGTLDGNKLISLEISNTASLEKYMNNKISGVMWNFKDFDTTSKDINESTVNVLLNKGDYLRVVHREIKDTSAYNFLINKSALGGHQQYVVETEVRYTCPTGFELEVLSTFDAATQSKDKLVYVLGTSREIVFNRNGFTYNLTDANGNKLYAEDVTEDATKFTKIAVIVDEAAGNYSIYVNGKVAYYNYGEDIVTATAIDIDKTPIYEPDGMLSQTSSTLSINNMPTSTSADALLDIKSVNLYVLRTGVAPYVMATQSKVEATKFDVRFIAPIDMLYGTEVGFDITTNQSNSKEVTRSSNIVYSSVKAIDETTQTERDFTADEFDGTYLTVISVTGASVVDTVEFTVKPFIIIGDSKIYNESFTVTYSGGKAVTE